MKKAAKILFFVVVPGGVILYLIYRIFSKNSPGTSPTLANLTGGVAPGAKPAGELAGTIGKLFGGFGGASGGSGGVTPALSLLGGNSGAGVNIDFTSAIKQIFSSIGDLTKYVANELAAIASPLSGNFNYEGLYKPSTFSNAIAYDAQPQKTTAPFLIGGDQGAVQSNLLDILSGGISGLTENFTDSLSSAFDYISASGNNGFGSDQTFSTISAPFNPIVTTTPSIFSNIFDLGTLDAAQVKTLDLGDPGLSESRIAGVFEGNTYGGLFPDAGTYTGIANANQATSNYFNNPIHYTFDGSGSNFIDESNPSFLPAEFSNGTFDFSGGGFDEGGFDPTGFA